MNGFGEAAVVDPLSGREVEVLVLLAEGFSNREIAQKLYISLETVKWYNKQIYSKLDVHSRTQAVARAREMGLLDDVRTTSFSGTVTFLFTDIEGSTTLWQRHPDTMEVALQQHDALIRRAIKENDGRVFKTMGDAFYAVFDDATNALSAALGAQTATLAQDWGKTPIRIRMALNTGAAEVRDGDYFGLSVNRTARLLSVGHGGQILISASTQTLAQNQLPDGLSLRDLGEHRLKDLEHTERIYQLIAFDLPADFPPLKSMDYYPTNLPVQLTSFIGREREIVELTELLGKARLITLTGPGGTGKTRLCLEVASRSAEQYRDGATFVGLASIADHDLVPNAIANELGVTEKSNRSLVESLQRYLSNKHMLMVLDNFEHVMKSAPLVTDLLALAPRLTIMVTSREVMRLNGEFEYPVRPLSVPDQKQPEPVSDLLVYESVALFNQRALASVPSFQLTKENASAVAAICARLDGLPLAIELAAVRVKRFKPQYLLERLEDSLGLLTKGPRDLPVRQRTLRGTIDWSYNLLNRSEQILFARLGVFRGGRSIDAVESICGPGLSIDPLDGLESLLDKSLLTQEEGLSGEPRFKMLQTIQEYAQERLAESGEERIIRNRHLGYFLELMEEAEPKLEGLEQVAWLKRLEIEHDNLMTAAYWSQSTEETAELALRLISSLVEYLLLRSYFSKGRELLSAALSTEKSSQHMATRAKALQQAGLLAYMQSDYPATRNLLKESLSIYRELGPTGRRGLANALITLGDMETEVGEYAVASSLMKEALGIMRELDDDIGIARALWQLGQCNVRHGDYEQAVQYFELALPLLRRIGDRTATSIALSGLAEIAIREGDYDSATTLEEESLALRREIGERWGIAVSLANFAWIALRMDDLKQATALLKESLTIRQEIGDIGGFAWCLEKMAEIALKKGLARSATRRREKIRQAAILFGAAAALRAPIGSSIDLVDQHDYERQLAEVRAQLDESSFNMAWAAGASMTIEQAATYALTE